jgi:hypothetical protein
MRTLFEKQKGKGSKMLKNIRKIIKGGGLGLVVAALAASIGLTPAYAYLPPGTLITSFEPSPALTAVPNDGDSVTMRATVTSAAVACNISLLSGIGAAVFPAFDLIPSGGIVQKTVQVTAGSLVNGGVSVWCVNSAFNPSGDYFEETDNNTEFAQYDFASVTNVDQPVISNPSITVNGAGDMTITWSATDGDGIADYEIRVYNQTAGAEVDTSDYDGTSESYTIPAGTLTAGSVYQISITANDLGDPPRSGFSFRSIIYTGTGIEDANTISPTAAKDVKTNVLENGDVVISWTASTDADGIAGYSVAISPKAGGASVFFTPENISATSITIPADVFTKGTEYLITIGVFDSGNPQLSSFADSSFTYNGYVEPPGPSDSGFGIIMNNPVIVLIGGVVVAGLVLVTRRKSARR